MQGHLFSYHLITKASIPHSRNYKGEWVQAFDAKISGIIWMDKHKLWLVDGNQGNHYPIISNPCPPKPCIGSLYPFPWWFVVWGIRARSLRTSKMKMIVLLFPVLCPLCLFILNLYTLRVSDFMTGMCFSDPDCELFLCTHLLDLYRTERYPHMPTFTDYPEVSRIWHWSPTLPYRSPNLPR